ncbi:MAG: LytTR family DNA-binding domain-containing protein [Bacteroidales bacterium]|jgi:two-component system LytT family response regulator|nr:LytTR family DNA-binding domain-containing protein [Bacteroidales bacterium]
MELAIFEKCYDQDMLRTVIIDDEDLVRETIRRLLAMVCPQVKLVGEAGGVESGLKIIRELHPHLVLLDIRMDDGTGFDLLHRFDSIDFKVIFITAYEKYAVQAFRFAAIDFLLKPINPEDLSAAVKRAETLIQEHFNSQVQALEENLRTEFRQKKKIVLKTQGNIYLIDLQTITHCESDGCYTYVHTTAGDRILITKTLKEFDEMFSDCGFYRIHKSYLINLTQIKRFEKQEGGFVILNNDCKIPVASRKREELLELFEKLAE